MLQGRPGGLRQTVHQGGQTHEVVFTTTALARDAGGSLKVNRWRWAVLARCFSSCVHPTGQRRQNSLWSGKRWDLSSVGAARLELPGWTLGEPGEPGSGAPSAIVGGPRPFMTTAGVLLHQVLL